MTACIFVGPTLAAADVTTRLDAVCLPPVAQGDVLRAVKGFRPRTIGIIDGLFGGAPAVWHKEILWAMSEGVAVFGSASMGALRAAELHRFGMRGVGRIFEAYRDGDLEDDDEVAVIHGPSDIGFPVLSEPMVNIRATLARAEREAVLRPDSRARLERAAKALFFADRIWPNVLESPEGHLLDSVEEDAFKPWLTDGRVDLKRDDALAMLAAIGASQATEHLQDVPFHFERTHHWAGLVARDRRDASDRPESTVERMVLDELLLSPKAPLTLIRDHALLRYAGDRLAAEGEDGTQPAARDLALGKMRANLGLFTQADFEAWIARNDLNAGSLETLADRAAHLHALAAAADRSLPGYVLDELRSTGMYEALAGRSRLKAERLSSVGDPDRKDEAPADRLARRQLFLEELSRTYGSIEFDNLLKLLGFGDLARLDRVLRREHIYLTLSSPGNEDQAGSWRTQVCRDTG